MTLYLELYSGIQYQKITLNENDIKYRDLLKYIKFESKYRIFDASSKNFPYEIFYKPKIKLFNKTEKINLDDDICLDKNVLNIVFNNKYLLYFYNLYNRLDLFEFSKNLNEQEIEIQRLSLLQVGLINSGFDISKIPQEYITQELCNIAIKNSITSIKSIPEKYRTHKIYKMIIDFIYKKQNSHISGIIFKHLPEEYITQELCDIVVKEGCIL
jgi:hypothetical protein